MEGELGLVDEGGVLYYGEVGHPFIQAAKLEEEVHAVVPTGTTYRRLCCFALIIALIQIVLAFC